MTDKMKSDQRVIVLNPPAKSVSEQRMYLQERYPGMMGTHKFSLPFRCAETKGELRRAVKGWLQSFPSGKAPKPAIGHGSE